MKNHTDLNLGVSLSILTSFNFSDSGIYRFVLVECIWSEIRQTRDFKIGRVRSESSI